jgi:hypothetical protein
MLLQEDLMPALAALFSNLLDPNLPVERTGRSSTPLCCDRL